VVVGWPSPLDEGGAYESVGRISTLVGVAAVTLIEAAARDLEDFSEKIMAPGHWPSWSYPQVPDGLALCVGCWRPIMALERGVEPCPGARRERLAEYLK
jgi:hypothetical protein